MTRASGIAVILALTTSCSKNPESTGEGAGPAGSTPRISLSSQPWRSGGTVGVAPGSKEPIATDGREVTAGKKMAADAASGCKDDKCRGSKCGELCTQWMSENMKSYRSVNHKNVVYFNCLGACLSGSDRGAK